MTTLQTWSVGNTAACAKQRHACTSAGNPVTASMGCRAFEKNASGRLGASEGKARTCAHATQGQREPAFAEMNRSTELNRFRVLPLSPPVCVLHLRGTRCRDEFALERVCSLVTPGQVKPKARVFEFFRLTLILRRRGIFAFRVFVFGRLRLRRTACHASYKA